MEFCLCILKIKESITKLNLEFLKDSNGSQMRILWEKI